MTTFKIKNIGLFIVVGLLYACVQEPKNNKNNTKKVVVDEIIETETVPIEEKIEIPNKEPLDVRNNLLHYYQEAVAVHEKKEILPEKLLLINRENGGLFEEGVLFFDGILKTTTNWFLCRLMSSEGELENIYYFTFDYNGTQLDAKMVLETSECCHGSIVFNTDSTFIITETIEEGELDENDHFVVLSSRKDVTNYLINSKGKIKPIK